MGSRSRRLEDGLEDARLLIGRLGREIREARSAAGLSQAAAARAAGMSQAQWSRLERGVLQQPDLVQACCAARVLGLRASLKLYPVALPLRDLPQQRVYLRFSDLLGAPLRPHAEAVLPADADLRAWDVLVTGAETPFVGDIETHIADVQAVERRIRGKQRDDPRATVVLLILARTEHHRRLLADHREVLRDLLPLDPAPILAALRAGRRPPGSGIILV